MRKPIATLLAAATIATTLGSAMPAAFAFPPPPPPLRYEVRPVIPHPGWIWRPGYWNWVGGRYVWVGGLWVAPGGPGWRAGWHWVPGHWTRWGRWIRPHWAP